MTHAVRADRTVHDYVVSLLRYYQDLSSQEEDALIERYRHAKDEHAVRVLIARYVRLAVYIMHRRFRLPPEHQHDALQESLMGFVRALSSYNRSQSTLATYAAEWIRYYLHRYVRDHGYVTSVRRPAAVISAIPHVRAACIALKKSGVPDPSPQDVHNHLRQHGPERLRHRSLSFIQIVMSQDVAPAVSLQDILPGHEERTYEAVIASPLRSPEELMEIRIFHDRHEALWKQVRLVAESLPPSIKHVINHRFGLDGAEMRTLKAIGLTLGITKERVRQLEGRGIRLLAKALCLEEEYLEQHLALRPELESLANAHSF